MHQGNTATLTVLKIVNKIVFDFCFDRHFALFWHTTDIQYDGRHDSPFSVGGRPEAGRAEPNLNISAPSVGSFQRTLPSAMTKENRSAHRIMCRRCTETKQSKQNGDQS